MSEKILLNIYGDLSESFSNYFEKAGIRIVTRGEIGPEDPLDFILVGSTEEANEFSNSYKCMERDIRIICMGPKEEIRDFLVSNGRLFINSDFLSQDLGEFILNKFITGNTNIHIDESFASSFDNFKKFNIINHLNIGQSLDRISVEAFEAGFNLVTLRSFLDHSIFYMTYLKQSEKAHIPFEFEYAHNDKAFVVNMYATVESFSAEFLMNAFGDINSENPLDFLLGVAAKSTDFMDITFVEDPGKLVITGFYSKDPSAKIKGLAFNNILTTSQILAQVEKKLENFEAQETLEVELSQKQNGMMDQNLPGGFFDIPQPPQDSVFNEKPQQKEEVVNFLGDKFAEAFPDKDFSQFRAEDLDQFLGEFPDEGFAEHISDQDKQYLLDMVQNKNLIDEAQFQQQQLLENPQNGEMFKQNIANNVAEQMANKMDATKLNEILAGKGNQGEGFNIAVDPSSFQAPPFPNDPFATAPGEFADPVLAAEQAVQFAEDHFNDPMQAQAFAIQMAEKAHEHFEDPAQAQQFANILAENMGQTLAAPQQEAFAEVLENKAKGEQGPAINVFANASAMPGMMDDPFADQSFIAPEKAAQVLAEETLSQFENPAEAQAFALAQIAQARDKFPDEQSAQDFAQSLSEHMNFKDEKQQKVFQDAVKNQLNLDGLGQAAPPALFDGDDPFATAPGEFANAAEAAQKIAEIAKEKFDNPEEIQAFALNMAFQAQGQFPDAGDFAAALTDQFQDTFDSDEESSDFAVTVANLAGGFGPDAPQLENNPFGSNFVASAEAAQKIRGGAEEDQSTISIGGTEVGEEHSTKVKGGQEAADKFSQTLKATPQDKKGEFVARFSSSFEENTEKGAFNFKQGKPKDRKKEMNMFVKQTIDNDEALSKLDETMRAFIHSEAPEKLSLGLEKYAFDQGIDVSSLSDEMLMEFKQTELPSIMNDLLNDNQSADQFAQTLASAGSSEPMKVISGGNSEFDQKMKDLLELNIEGFEGVKREDGTLVVSDDLMASPEFQTAVQQSMSQAIEQDMQVRDYSPEGLEMVQMETAQNLANMMDFDPVQAQQVVQQSAQQAQQQVQQQVQQQNQQPMQQQPMQEQPMQQQGQAQQTMQEQPMQQQGQAQQPQAQPQQVVASNKQAEMALMKKVKTAENEKKDLEKKLKALSVQLKAAQTTNEKLQKISEDSKVSDDEVEKAVQEEQAKKPAKEKIPEPTISHGEKQKLMEDLKSGRDLNPEEVERLNKALESEQKVRELAKNAEKEVKKMQMETQKREQVFKTEISKAEKALKAKDSVLDKAKEDMKNTLGKKEKEMEHYRNQVQELNQKLANDKSTQLKTELKATKKEAENALKMSEVYKNKLEEMAKKANESKKDDNTALVQEENRNLKRMKTQLENKVNTDTKMLRSLEERFNKSKQGEMEAKNHLAQYKGQLKQTQGQLKLLQTQNEKLKNDAAKAGRMTGVEDKEVSLLKDQNLKLHDNIRKLNAKLEQAAKASLDQGKKAEAVAVQKAQKDLEASKKEIDLVKEQNAKLQEKIQKLTKDIQDVDVKEVDQEKVAEVAAAKDEKADKAAAKEVGALKKQNEELQEKLKRFADKLKKAEQSASSTEPSKKEQMMEQSVKKMNAELTKAMAEKDEIKKKAMTMKTKFTGLENENAKLKKENEKLKQVAANAAKKAKKAA